MGIDRLDLNNFERLLEKRPDKSAPQYAIATTPNGSWFFYSADGETFLDHEGREVNLSQAYDVIVFCESWQIHALRNGQGVTLTILHAADAELGQQYLLWGTVTEDSKRDDWTVLADARIGAINVPFMEEISGGERVCIKARELLGTDDYGNCHVLAQRYTGFAKYQAEDAEAGQ